jgi:20S proteasome alpha/beta subunit
MRSKLMESAAKSVLPSFAVEHLGPLSHGEVKASGMRSGTTIVAFRGGDRKKGNDFLVCAADRKTSLGYYGIASQRTKKIFQLAENSVFLGAGGVGNIQELRNLLKAQCDEFLEVHGSTMSIPGQAFFRRVAFFLRCSLSGHERE